MRTTDSPRLLSVLDKGRSIPYDLHLGKEPTKGPKTMLEIALQAARTGGEILRRRFGTTLHIEHKGKKDLVTEVDRESEAAIVATLRSRCPEDDILGEEGEYVPRHAPARWIIDPLDGTTNFVHGFPWFAVSIAREVRGEIVLGVIYNPYFEELYVAEKGRGARLNNRPIRVSTTAPLDQGLLATGFAPASAASRANNLDHFVHFQQSAQACRRPGAASLDLACVAAGRFDGFWEMLLKPWDTAAGLLLVSEAGGRVSDFDGRPFDPFGPECLASNGLIHEEMIAVLRKGKRP